jgi:hypothetical protein
MGLFASERSSLGRLLLVSRAQLTFASPPSFAATLSGVGAFSFFLLQDTPMPSRIPGSPTYQA